MHIDSIRTGLFMADNDAARLFMSWEVWTHHKVWHQRGQGAASQQMHPREEDKVAGRREDRLRGAARIA